MTCASNFSKGQKVTDFPIGQSSGRMWKPRQEHCIEKHMVSIRKTEVRAKALVLIFTTGLGRGLIRPMPMPGFCLERRK